MPVDRPVIVEISSKDVIHNFALPHMRIAQDAIPGSIIPMWFKPIKTGSYEIVCGQLCGLGHYGMKGTIVVDSPADYQAWLKERQELSAQRERPGSDHAAGRRAEFRSDAGQHSACRCAQEHESSRVTCACSGRFAGLTTASVSPCGCRLSDGSYSCSHARCTGRSFDFPSGSAIVCLWRDPLLTAG